MTYEEERELIRMVTENNIMLKSIVITQYIMNVEMRTVDCCPHFIVKHPNYNSLN